MRKVFLFFLKVLKWVSVTVLSLLILILICINLPAVHSFALEKSIAFFNEKTGGQLSISDIDLRLPRYIQIEGLKLIDPAGDQVITADNIEIELSWHYLLNNKIELDFVKLEGLKGGVISDKAGNWNYDFIVDGFSSDAEEESPQSTSEPWDFGIDEIEITGNNLFFIDESIGDSIRFQIGDLEIEMDDFSVLKNTYVVDQIQLSNTEGLIQIGQHNSEAPDSAPTDTNAAPFILGLNSLHLNENQIRYQSSGTADYYSFDIGAFDIEINEFDLDSLNMDVQSLEIARSSFDALITPTETQSDAPLEIFAPIHLKSGEIKISDFDVAIENGNPREAIHLSGINLDIPTLSATPNSYQLDLDKGSVNYNNQVLVQNLRLQTELNENAIALNALNLTAEGSQIAANGSISFERLDSLIAGGIFENLEFDIKQFKITPALASVFIPDSVVTIDKNLNLATTLSGNDSEIQIENLNLKYGASIVQLIGRLNGENLSDINYQVESLRADILRDDFRSILEDFKIDTTYIPSSVQLAANGRLTKDITNFNGDVSTPFGQIDINVSGDGQANEFENLNIKVASTSFEAGNFLKMPEVLDFGIEAHAQVNLADSLPAGNGFIRIDNLHYSNLNLNELDIVFDGNSDKYDVEVNAIDSFLVAEICAELTIDSSIVAIAEGKVEGANLAGLGLTSNDFRGALDFVANFEQSNTFNKGDFLISDIIFIREGERGAIDPITGSFYLSDDSTVAAIDNTAIKFKSNSNRSPKELSIAIADVIKAGTETISDSTAFWNAEFNIRDLPQIRETLFPELKEFESAIGTVDFSAAEQKIKADVDIPNVVYNKFHLEDFKFIATGSADNISSNLSIQRFSLDTIGINDINFSTQSAPQHTEIKLQIDNDSTKVRYQMLANLEADSISLINGFNINFQEPLVLNEELWSLDSLNKIHFDGRGINIEQFNINKGTDSLSISKNKTEETISIRASTFDLTTISGILNLPEPLARGELFGDLIVHKNGSFSGEGYIQEFEIAHAEFGLFKWKAINTLNQYDITVETNGKDVQFDAGGTIETVNTNIANLDFDINIQKLDINALHKVFPNKLTHGDGQAEGRLKLTGTNLKPLAVGSLKMDDVEIGLAANGAIYNIKDQQVNIGTDYIGFENFTVIDSANQNLVVNGKIKHEYFENFETNLEVQTEEFSILSLTEQENNRLYGNLLAGTKIKVKGKLDAPTIDAKIKISDKTNLTYVVPESDYQEQHNEDLLEWTDFQSSIETNPLLGDNKSANRKSYIQKSIELSGAFDIDERAVFRVVVDSAAGDFLEIKGGGKIGISYDRAGNFRMNGVYKVTDGFYKMTFYDIVKRTFDFQEGSSLTWNGDPAEALIDITAIYKIRASVAGLMASEGSENAAQSFQEQLPFEVKMKMEGDLTQPEISFSIDLQSDQRGAYGGAVEAKLNELRQDENELNKQVFALLVLNTFISSGSSSDQNIAANQARNSASQILSQQLNSLSDQYISGVDLNFDLQSYGGVAGEGNTDLNIDLAKSFLDDRMVVRVGSTIALESNNVNASDEQTVMTNIAIEYKLTPDGRYRFKVFQKTDMEDIVVGRITRTGAGILFQRDFDRIDELFKSDEETKNAEAETPSETNESKENTGKDK